MSIKSRIEELENKTAGVGHTDIAGLLCAVRERMRAPQGKESAAPKGKETVHRTDLASRLAAAREREARHRLEELSRAAAKAAGEGQPPEGTAAANAVPSGSSTREQA